MKILLAVLLALPGLAAAQSSDAAFAAALSAARKTAAGLVKQMPVSGKKTAAAPARAVAQQAVPAVKGCDLAVAKYAGSNAALMLLTETAAYYTHQDCDICDELDACDLKTWKVGTLIMSHSVSCEDLAPYRKGKVAYDACASAR